MRRRNFALLLGGAPVAWPLFARAQSSTKRWRVGLLNYSEAEANRVRLWDVFRQRLRELGYVEGDNITFELRWAGGRIDRLPPLATELVRLKVDVIVTAATPATLAAKQATGTIPIVTATGSDPVSSGVVASLSRPGGNVTGVSTLDSELPPKRLALLREMLPGVTRVATLVDTNYAASTLNTNETRRGAQSLGMSLQVVSVRSPGDFDDAFKSMLQPRAGALIIQPSAMFAGEHSRLAGLAVKYGIPTVGNERAYAEAGFLMSYGTDFYDNFRRAAEYVDRILKGAKPGDLPMEQPTKFELVINLRTAKVLGITVPRALLLRADQVIE